MLGLVVGLLEVACGSGDVPLDQQERWKCRINIISKSARTCKACNSDADCEGLLTPYTFCAKGRSADKTVFGGCIAPVNTGGVNAGDCDLQMRDITPQQVGGQTFNADTCVPKGTAAADADSCCRERCECIFNGGDGCGPINPSPLQCFTHNEDPSIDPGAPVPDGTDPSKPMACDGTEAGLQHHCSPTLSIPEGHSKAQVATSLDSSSRAKITVDDHESPDLTPSGTVRYTVEPCGAAACAMHITALRLTVPGFDIGKPVDHVVIQTARESTDTSVDMATGKYCLNAQTMRIGMNFSIDGTAGSITRHNDVSLCGQVDLVTGAWSLTGHFKAKEGDTAVDVNLDLHATPFNRPPVAIAKPQGDIECNGPRKASVVLDATDSTDPESNIFSYTWALSGTGPIAFGATVPYVLPYGPNALQLRALDLEFAEGDDSRAINVVDTTAPVLETAIDPTCLWPPNHKMILFELGNGFSASANDICDPSPTAEIVSVTSNQPPLGGGQGNFAPDVRFGKHAFCVRAERQGTDPSPRIYTIRVEARDFAGNVTPRTLSITIDHDQSDARCQHVPDSRIVDDTDPRCVQD